MTEKARRTRNTSATTTRRALPPPRSDAEAERTPLVKGFLHFPVPDEVLRFIRTHDLNIASIICEPHFWMDVAWTKQGHKWQIMVSGATGRGHALCNGHLLLACASILNQERPWFPPPDQKSLFDSIDAYTSAIRHKKTRDFVHEELHVINDAFWAGVNFLYLLENKHIDLSTAIEFVDEDLSRTFDNKDFHSGAALLAALYHCRGIRRMSSVLMRFKTDIFDIPGVIALYGERYDFYSVNLHHLVRIFEKVHESDIQGDMPMPRRYKSVFISYGSKDEAFAAKLNIQLKAHGVKTWFFKDDAVPGETLASTMFRGVNKHDRVILICSKSSLSRNGVLNEIEQAIRRETREGGRAVLIPIRLDDHVFSDWAKERPEIGQAVRDRVVADFVGAARSSARFNTAMQALIKALSK